MLRRWGDVSEAGNRIHFLEQTKFLVISTCFLTLSDLIDDSVSLSFARARRLSAPPATVTFADDCAFGGRWIRGAASSCLSIDS